MLVNAHCLGFGESTGIPFPHHILSAADAVMQFATKKLGFDESQIVLYAWSIGGFSASWVAANYQNVRGVVLDACFDDLLPLAEARMPSFMSSLVSYTVKEYLHLPVSEQVNFFVLLFALHLLNGFCNINNFDYHAQSRLEIAIILPSILFFVFLNMFLSIKRVCFRSISTPDL